MSPLMVYGTVQYSTFTGLNTSPEYRPELSQLPFEGLVGAPQLQDGNNHKDCH